jgi:adenosylcobinamide kinase/adenosylcobinamide-phosphate guanylyltransferase
LPQVTYIATAQASDSEMREKIDRHTAERPAHWATIEEPLELGRVIASRSRECGAILVDCLTVFVSNLLEADAAR